MTEYEWDEKKNKANLEKHKISFEEAKLIFNGPVVSSIDDRNEYGETRKISIGAILGEIVIVVITTNRAEKTRIISARTANKKERIRYHEYLQKTIRRA